MWGGATAAQIALGKRGVWEMKSKQTDAARRLILPLTHTVRTQECSQDIGSARLITWLTAFAAIVLAWPLSAVSQQYPNRVVRMVVPGPAGSNTDALARMVAQRLSTEWARQVIVDNRPGASGLIGTEAVVRAPPDGYTIMVGHNGTHAINVSLQKVPYDPVRDFVAIAIAAKFPNVIIVHPSLPVRSVKDLIAFAKARPGQLTYGTAAVGYPGHLAAEVLSARAGITMTHIPYKGTPPALIDTVAGNISLMFSNLPQALPQITAGRVRAIAVTSLSRSQAAPDIPTVAEAAFPGYEVITWWGFFGPAGIPPDIVRALHGDITRAMLSPNVKSALESQGGEVVTLSSEEFAAYVVTEVNRWGEIVKGSKAKAE